MFNNIEIILMTIFSAICVRCAYVLDREEEEKYERRKRKVRDELREEAAQNQDARNDARNSAIAIFDKRMAQEREKHEEICGLKKVFDPKDIAEQTAYIYGKLSELER